MTDVAAAIRAGAFDGTPHAPAELARILAEARREDLDAALRDHVRAALRSADARRVGTALTHLDITTRAGAAVARALIDEAYAAPAAPAWAALSTRDPEGAARLRAEVEQVADDAARRIASGTCGAR
jgi:hypothetical protein